MFSLCTIYTVSANYSVCVPYILYQLFFVSGILVKQYLQRVTPSLDLGVELLFQYGQQIPGGMVSVLSAAGRYSGE